METVPVAPVKLGISNVKILVVAVATFSSASATIMADGKVGITDFPALIKLSTEIGILAHLDVKAIMPEIGDLDAEEMHELVQVFDDNFNLEGDFQTIEAKVEAGLAALVKAVESIQFVIGLTKSKTV